MKKLRANSVVFKEIRYFHTHNFKQVSLTSILTDVVKVKNDSIFLLVFEYEHVSLAYIVNNALFVIKHDILAFTGLFILFVILSLYLLVHSLVTRHCLTSKYSGRGMLIITTLNIHRIFQLLGLIFVLIFDILYFD